MKIEKIKNFNQIVLAIASVLGVILLLVFIISEFWYWGAGSGRNTTITNSLIAEGKVEMLNQDNQRLQIISYETPQLIDTANVVYVIPVLVSTLDKPESVVDAAGDDGISYMFSQRSMRKKGYYQENYFEGLFANLIVYEPIVNKTVMLFDQRIILGDLRSYHFKDDILLVFFTAENDTNNDGLINFKDDTNLCVYSLRSGKIRRIAEGSNSVTDYQFINASKDLLVEFSLSQYKDVKFKSYKPRKIMKYVFESDALIEVIPPQTQQQMQNLVEGKKSQ